MEIRDLQVPPTRPKAKWSAQYNFVDHKILISLVFRFAAIRATVCKIRPFEV